jgi:hypothetical protein
MAPRMNKRGDAFLTMLSWMLQNLSETEILEYFASAELPDTTGIPSWMVAQLQFPYEAGLTWTTALAGGDPTSPDYTEIDAFPEVQSRRTLLEWYVQDTWKASQRVTLDLGVRFLYYQPWYTQLRAAVFVPERYDAARAPRLYQPTRINNVNLAIDPVTGETRPNIFVGSFVPGTGDPYNGMVTNDDPDYPRGFRDSQGIEPQPRIGLAWDIFGDGKMALHTSAGLYYNAHITARSMDSAANNPPAVNTPSIFYGTMDTLIQGAAFTQRPSNVFGLERDAKTPRSYNYSVGIQRELGWGTVVDVTYSGSVTRNLEVVRNINVVPDGARFLDINPQNRDPRNTANPLPAEFLRPYRGYQDISIRSHFGTSDYNGLQIQLNRRYIRGLQFAVAYSLGKTRGIADEDEAAISFVRPIDDWNYAPYASSQTHNLVFNYTWDLPPLSSVWNNTLIKGIFDNWQLSGENAFVSGDWSPIILATTDTFDFTGGDGGTGTDIGGGVRTVRPVVNGDLAGGDRNATPDASGSWINWAAVARPAGRGDFGNAKRNAFQLPAIVNWNLSFFKNFPVGGRRRVQLRWEIYNLLNQTQFLTLDNTARFDTAGVQVNQNFGKATAARNPRIMQGALRFTF